MSQKMNPTQDAFDSLLLMTFEKPYRASALNTEMNKAELEADNVKAQTLREYLAQYPEHGEVQTMTGRRHASNLTLDTQLSMGDTIDSTLLHRAERLLALKTVRGENTKELEGALIGWLAQPATQPKWAHSSSDHAHAAPGHEIADTPDQIFRHENKQHFRGDVLGEADVTHLVTTFTQLLKQTFAKDGKFKEIAGISDGMKR